MSSFGSLVPGATGLPPSSVAPAMSTTWINADASIISERNWLPRPLPLCAPGTRPAISTSFTGTNLVPFTHLELRGLQVKWKALHGQGALTYVTPLFGSIVVKILLLISASTSVDALKNVVFPTFDLPTTPISMN